MRLGTGFRSRLGACCPLHGAAMLRGLRFECDRLTIRGGPRGPAAKRDVTRSSLPAAGGSIGGHLVSALLAAGNTVQRSMASRSRSGTNSLTPTLTSDKRTCRCWIKHDTWFRGVNGSYDLAADTGRGKSGVHREPYRELAEGG